MLTDVLTTKILKYFKILINKRKLLQTICGKVFFYRNLKN